MDEVKFLDSDGNVIASFQAQSIIRRVYWISRIQTWSLEIQCDLPVDFEQLPEFIGNTTAIMVGDRLYSLDTNEASLAEHPQTPGVTRMNLGRRL